MIYHEAFSEHSVRYNDMDCSHSLKITATFASPPAGYDYPHFDNILASAVVQEATMGKGLPHSAEPYWLPLPLTLAWEDINGLPLWKSTDFIPTGENEKQASYWHKRKIHPHFVTRKKGKPLNIRGTEGVDKEYRIPLPRNTAIEWVAHCQGNMNEIGRLLCFILSIGKKTRQGHGAIVSYKLEPVAEFSYFHKNQCLRPLPLGVFSIIGNSFVQGWTPPYWLPNTHTQAFPTLSTITHIGG